MVAYYSVMEWVDPRVIQLMLAGAGKSVIMYEFSLTYLIEGRVSLMMSRSGWADDVLP
jgi:hypothetical protein